MAAEVWVLDIVWHVLLLAPNAVVSFWSSWSMEFLVLVSLLLHISLTIFAELRWHGAGPVLKFIVWLLYVCADYVGTSALGSLSVSSATGEHQLVALWGAFFLLHLGGPDSITAYSVEDNNLSRRDMLEALLRVLGAGYVVWTSVSGSWSLVISAWLMLVLGVSKYVEKILALYRANLDNIRSTVEKKEELVAQNGLDSGCGHCYGPRPWRWTGSESEYLQEEAEALLYAHSLFDNICMHAMVDASDVKEDPAAQEGTSSSLLDRGWKDMCKVVKMQLSLMYDVLYTKAPVIHTCPGYCIRVLAPIFTATAFVLFELSDPDQGGRDLRADIMITRVLLGATLLLETASLFRALGSSWAASALRCSKRRWSWLRHAVLCKGRWHRLHRALASLGRIIICALRLKGGYKRWSGSMGQFNLLRFCSTRDDPEDLCSMLAKMFGVEDEDWWTKFRHSRTIEIPECVKRLLFERVKEMLEDIKDTKKSLLEQRKKPKDEDVDQKLVKDSMDKLDRFRTQRGEAALEGLGRMVGMDLRWSLGDELQEGILTWHIATHVFLFKSNKAKAESAMPYVKAIGTLSSYMMFLLAFRPDMLPGLALRSLYRLTCQDLFRLSSDYRNRSRWCRPRPRRSLWDIIIRALLKRLFRWHGHPCSSSRLSQAEEMLASILCGDYSIVDAALEDEGEPNANRVPPSAKIANQQYLMSTDSIKSYIPLGSKLADELLRMEETPGLDLLQAIFNVWVEMLLCSSYRCSRDSHAKHLSNGGELTTVVWLTVEHAGLFPIDKDSKVQASIKQPPGPPTIRVSPPHTPRQECEATGIGHSEVNIRIYGLF